MTEQDVTWRRWQRLAPQYDRAMRWVERRLIPGCREWIGGRAHGDVLEIAAGTGLNLPHYPGDARVTAVDFSPAMTGIARRRAADLGMDVRFVLADAARLPFPDDGFDTVVSTLSLCEIPDNVAAVAEMRRVLRPGGRLLLLDHVGSTWPPILLGQKIVELVLSRPFAGEHLTRRQLPHVRGAGFTVEETIRDKAGIVERVSARLPEE